MKAMVFHKPNEPLKLEDVPCPSLSHEEVLVKVKVTGVCASDVKMFHGDIQVTPPKILGHEIAGIVDKVGDNVKTLRVGDRVCVNPIISCGHCFNCISGRDNICVNWRTYGIHENGGFAEYIKVKERNCVRLPDNVSFEEGALATDAVAAPFHAIKRAKIGLGDFVVIYGSGGLGFHAIKLAKLSGAIVACVDISEERLELAKKAGSDIIINSQNGDPVEEILSITDNMGANASMEFVGSPISIKNAVNSVRKGGKVVLVGICVQDISVDPKIIVRKEIEVIGSYAQCKSDIIEVLNMVSSGSLDLSQSITHRFPLEEVNLALETLDKKIGNPIRVAVTVE